MNRNAHTFLARARASLVLGMTALRLTIAAAELPEDDAHQRPIPTRQIDFDQEISPILSRHCLECHGPDNQARKAKLRLDLEDSAKGPARSGIPAIVPGKPNASELIARITHADPDHRMPPEDSGTTLTDAEISLLKAWIAEGAPYQGHWAYQPFDAPTLPEIREDQWARQPLDFFILNQLESRNLRPAPPATRREWIRRVYFDLIGLPPTPDEIDTFLNDSSPTAFQGVADRLLSSPRYGERWARHWLDVARYGDSNGGDENHAYPFAYPYRNYVIDAFNAGTPYDTFLKEQLAGDLLPASPSLRQQLNRLKATGFLAIGTKILAEQDPVKKQADTVDEQIDTVSKALLGVTVACARCHDHKFDPIPTKDYYAFAGIFHSTMIGTEPLKTEAFEKKEFQFRERIKHIEHRLAEYEQRWKDLQQPDSTQHFEAENFDQGNVQKDFESYGKEIGIISDPGSQDNFAEYEFETTAEGRYALEIRYAAEKARPGKIRLDGEVIADAAFNTTTGGWFPEHQTWHLAAVFNVSQGTHRLRFESKPLMVHIDRFRLIALKSDSESIIDQLMVLRKERASLKQQAPKPEETMAVKEGEVRHVKVHIRGDHNQLGELVPRGFLSEIGSSTAHTIPTDQSGRLQLANWLTDPHHPLTARVFVNRVWRWHFGKGLVESTENFGTRGSRPTHPQLLNYLAKYLIDQGWSIKALHRSIVLSSTYRMSSQHSNPEAMQRDPSNQFYWRRDMRRLEAEAFRDSLLALSGRLNTELGGGPMNVKSQDPSPEDLVKNREIYERSSRRSVYLPVVRSNVYDFLTLLDFPNAASPVGNRPTTTVPTQALLLMNHDFVQAESERILDRVLDQHPNVHGAALIEKLYLHLLGRPPSSEELKLATRFDQSYQKTVDHPTNAPSAKGMIALCHTLLMSNDFAYIR